MAQDNSAWNSVKQAINIPLMSDVGKTVTVTSQSAGIGGYELTIRTDESIKLENSITDYYAEDNSSLQDNIALKPITFTINGIIGEKFMDVKSATSRAEMITNALSPVLPMLPDCTSFILQTLVVAEAIEKVARIALEQTSDFINSLMGTPNNASLNNQEQAFLFFYSAYKSRELMEVSLPYATLNNCAITSVEITQPASTRMLSNIQISFKQMNFASTRSGVGTGATGRRKTQAGATPPTNLSNVGTSSNGGTQSADLGARKIN